MTVRNDNIDSSRDDLHRSLTQVDSDERLALRKVWEQIDLSATAPAVNAGLRDEVRSRLLDEVGVRSQGIKSRGVRSQSDIRPGRRPQLRLINKLLLFPRSAYSVAAVITILIGMSFFLAPNVHVIRTPNGSAQARGFALPDGTTGYLSAGSELRYTDAFGRAERAVYLRGEAMFDVTKDGTAFRVKTYNTTVSVLGTSFSVRSWPSDVEPQTLVSVREGSVAVKHRYRETEGVVLSPAEYINVGPDRPVVPASIESTSDYVFNWISGGVDFVDMPVGSVLNELSRRFDTNLRAPHDVRDRRVTLLSSETAAVEDILVDISAALNLQYRKIAGGFELYLD